MKIRDVADDEAEEPWDPKDDPHDDVIERLSKVYGKP